VPSGRFSDLASPLDRAAVRDAFADLAEPHSAPQRACAARSRLSGARRSSMRCQREDV